MKIRSMKFWNLIGIIVGIAIIITGVVVMKNPPSSSSTQSSELVSFGGDYYTYQYSATRNAGINAAAAANNLREIGEMLALYAGLLFIALGLLTTVKYAKRFFVEVDFVDDEDFDYDEIMESINEELAAAEETENEDDNFIVVDETEEETMLEEEVSEEEISAETETL